MAQEGPKKTPRRPQDDPKTAPRRFGFACRRQLLTQMLPRCAQDGPRGPKRPPTGPQEPPRGPQEPPRGSRERPSGPQEAPQRPPRGLHELIFSLRMAISCGRGVVFQAPHKACDMSPLGRRRGPALRA